MDCKGFTESMRETTNSSLTNTPENSYSTKHILIIIILTVITIAFFAIVVFLFYWLKCEDKNNSNSREKTTNDEMEEQIEEIQSSKTLFQKSSSLYETGPFNTNISEESVEKTNESTIKRLANLNVIKKK
jgi:flagellar basal body-associated protein FliL